MLNNNYKKAFLGLMIFMGSNFTSEKSKEKKQEEETVVENEKLELKILDTQKEASLKSTIEKDFFEVKSKNWVDRQKYFKIVAANYYVSNNLISEKVDGTNESGDCTIVKDKLFYLKNKKIARITKFDDAMSAEDILKLLNKGVEIGLTDDLTFYMMAGPNYMTTNPYVLEGDMESLFNNPWTTNLFVLDKDNETLRVNKESLNTLPKQFQSDAKNNPTSTYEVLRQFNGCKIKDEKILKYFGDLNQKQMEFFRESTDKDIDLASLVSSNPEQNKKNLADAKKFFKETSEKAKKYYQEKELEIQKKENNKNVNSEDVSKIESPANGKDGKQPNAKDVLIGSVIILASNYGSYKWGKSSGRKEAPEAKMNGAAA